MNITHQITEAIDLFIFRTNLTPTRLYLGRIENKNLNELVYRTNPCGDSWANADPNAAGFRVWQGLEIFVVNAENHLTVS